MIFLTWLFSNLLFFEWLGNKHQENEFRKYINYYKKYGDKR